MVLEEENTGSNSGMAQALGRAQQQQRQAGAQPQQQQRQQGNGSLSWLGLGRLNNAPMSRNQASEILTKLHTAIAERIESSGDAEIKLIPMDINAFPDLAISCLVMTLTYPTNKRSGVAFTTLLIEGSIPKFEPRFENIAGQNVQIDRYTSDAYDEKLQQAVANEVARFYPSAQLHDACAVVVPRDFKIEDKSAIYQLTAGAITGCQTVLDLTTQDHPDLCLTDIGNDSSLVARMEIGNEPVQDMLGVPQRADIQVVVHAVQRQAQSNLVSRPVPISRVAGYIDLLWDPVNPVVNSYFGQQQGLYGQQPAVSPLYTPEFVITDIDSNQLVTLPAYLMALATTAVVREGDSWRAKFRPQAMRAGRIDMGDIGAIGFDANLERNPNGVGARIDTKADNFRGEHLGQLFQMLFRPGMSFAMDVSLTGPMSNITNIFLAAAYGSQEANQELLSAADYLTGGHFSRLYKGTGQVVQHTQNRIHVGTYTDEDGILQDLRNLDYLAVLNLIGDKDMSVAAQWSDTFYNTNVHLEKRLADRKKIITGLIPTAQITGVVERIRLEGEFANALFASAAAAGLNLKPQYPHSDFNSYQRAGAGLNSSFVVAPGTSGMLNYGLGATGGFNHNFHMPAGVASRYRG